MEFRVINSMNKNELEFKNKEYSNYDIPGFCTGI
jgi:hypothetical protein